MASNAFDILLRYVLDKKSYAEVQNGSKTVQEAMVGIEDANYAVGVSAIRLQPILDAQAKKTQELQNAWWKTQRVLRASAFTFQQLTIAGMAVVTPLVALATNFVKEMEKAGVVGDPVVKRWQAATTSLKENALQIGRITAETILPMLEKAAEIANKVTQFAQDNPDIIKTALKIGTAVATIGVLGTLVTQGVKFYVDVKFVIASAQNLLASELMIQAAKQNMLAAIAMERAGLGEAAADLLQKPIVGSMGGLTTTALKSALGWIVPIVVAAVALYVGAKGGTALGNWAGRKIYGEQYKEQDLGDVWTTVKRIAAIAAFNTSMVQLTDKTGEAKAKLWEQIKAAYGLSEATEQATQKFTNLTDQMERAGKEAEGLKILDKLADQLDKMEEKYAKDRVKIIDDANKRLADSARDYARDLAKAGRDLDKALADLERDYNRDLVKMERDYQRDRKEVIEDAHDDLAKIEEDYQEKLRKMALEHEQRVYDLVSARDALGLVQEERRYALELSEAERDRNREVRERRKELTKKLKQMQEEYALERQDRAEQYAQDRADAQERYKERVEELRQQHAEEMKQIVEDRDERLKELQKTYQAERKQAILNAYQKIAELGGAYDAERRLRLRYYDVYIADLEAFAIAYKEGLQDALDNAIPTTPPTAAGGYRGFSGRGENGSPEYVLSNSTTRAAEMLLGARLTQRNILAGLRGGGGTVTINDHRTFDSRISVEDRRQIINDTLQMWSEAVA